MQSWLHAYKADRSHIIIMAIIAIFTLHFIFANRKQRVGKKLIEETVSRRSGLIASSKRNSYRTSRMASGTLIKLAMT